MGKRTSTKEHIMEAFLALLEDKNLMDISVSEISERAGVSKRTFYNHFVDKYDLMGFSYRELVELQWYKDGKRCTLAEFFNRCWTFDGDEPMMERFKNTMSYIGQNDLRSEIENQGVKDLKRLLRWNGYTGPYDADLDNILLFFYVRHQPHGRAAFWKFPRHADNLAFRLRSEMFAVRNS